MRAIKKIQQNGRKFLSVLGVKIPYTTTQEGVSRYISFGALRVPYHFSSILRIPLPIFQSPNSIRRSGVGGQKENHYRQRDLWNSPEVIKTQLGLLYEQRLGHKLDFDNPKRFTEKLNCMKLKWHDPQITVCCDKYALKGYVDRVLNETHRIPTLAAWENVDAIDFNVLPKSFVLKVNWSSGYNLFIRNKDVLNARERERIRAQIEVWLRPEGNSYYDSFNWGYKDISPVVYAEPYLLPESTDQEYKVFCFNGKAKFILIELKNEERWKRVCVNCAGEKLPFTFGEQAIAECYDLPEDLDAILVMAEALAAPFPFVRVDFLGTPEYRMVGEMTFYSGGGFSKVNPDEWDEKIGDLLCL